MAVKGQRLPSVPFGAKRGVIYFHRSLLYCLFILRIEQSQLRPRTLCVDSPFDIATSHAMDSQQPSHPDATKAFDRPSSAQRSKEDMEAAKQEIAAGALNQKVNGLETSIRNVIRNFLSLW
jgi:hypothetical protein